MKLWPLPLRLLFRFVFCYDLLYTMPAHGSVSLFGIIPGASAIYNPYIKFWDGIEAWLAIHLFHLGGERVTRFPTGSGDTTMDYIQVLCFVALALVATLIWSILDRRRLEYRTLHGWLRVWIRYTLGATMLGYGFAKVFPLQFRLPGPLRLSEPYSEFSPMGVLWAFMGASTAYVIFSGAMEVLGGTLLFFRRTTTLGAMVCCAVITNIVVLNFCYDVPVKLYSTNLLLMALFLMAPDLRRLFRLLVLNQAAGPGDLSLPSFQNRKLRIAAMAVQVLFLGTIFYQEIHGGWQAYQQTRVHPQRPPLYGIYQVETLPTAKTSWRKLVVEFPAGVTVWTEDEKVRGFGAKYDTANRTVTLTAGKSAPPMTFAYSWPDADHLELSGPQTLLLRKIDPEKTQLMSRGFHWINERPFNR